MVDNESIWLGLDSGGGLELGEFALGGLLRVDRRTLALETIRDSMLLHADVVQLVPTSRNDLLVVTRLSDGRYFGTMRAGPTDLLAFNRTSRRVRRLPWPRDLGGAEVAYAHDTLFIAGGRDVAAFDLRAGTVVRRGFRFEVAGDSLIYALSDTTEVRDWDFLGAVGAARSLHVREAPFVRLAAGALKATGLIYDVPGDRMKITTRISAESHDADSSLAGYPAEEIYGPFKILVDGVDHPVLRPMLREALREGNTGYHPLIAEIMSAAADTGSVPDLRTALTRSRDWGAASLAAALSLLGDSTGTMWIQNALADTTPSASVATPPPIHDLAFEAAGRAQNRAYVPRLLELMRDSRYTLVAANALLDYQDPGVWQRCLGRVLSGESNSATRSLLYRIRDESADVMRVPAVRDSIRLLATRALFGEDTSSRDVAAEVMARHGSLDDIPILISTLDTDAPSYRRAVLALVRMTGTGDESMPLGPGTRMDWQAARAWWSAWYDRSRPTFRAAEPDAARVAWLRMLNRLRGERRELE